jgi:hypothetical protein
MNETQIQLLRDLVAHVKALPAERVNLRAVRCGTIACALGHAPNVPSWKAAGCGVATPNTTFGEHMETLPWSFARRILGIGEKGMNDLFGYPGYSKYDPEEWMLIGVDHRDLFALRVERFIADHSSQL